MTETTHVRSRRAALLGLTLQVLAAGGALALSFYTHSAALNLLATFIAAGIPLWLVAVLVFRQCELAALEKMDLEALRRERRRVGAGEAIFGAEGEAGFMVAERRLEWMRRWLVPVFGLVSAAILAGGGVAAWMFIRNFATTESWPALVHTDMGLILLTVLVVLLFFYARYAAGLGRVREWQLLRGCGSFMLGNAIAGGAIAVALAFHLYQRQTPDAGLWEHYAAQAIPILMVILGLETLLNFLLDVYRPRSPGTEPRAAFDSRLLGLISEPGGIAHSLQEAINYQFGFQVSQTWFYQLMERTLAPLVLVGVLAVWLLTCLVVVQPYERVIIERFGRQLDPGNPLGPGLHFKWPAPFELARRFNTGQLHEFVVGYKVGDEPATLERDEQGKVPIELWTDEKHSNRDHFDFITARHRRVHEDQPDVEQFAFETRAGDDDAPVHLVRMAVHVAYRVREDQLDRFTRNGSDPHRIIRRLAWNEVIEYAAASQYEELMGAGRRRMDHALRERLAARVAELALGLEVIYVGAQHVHPVKQVAEAFRDVVNAQQEQLAEIRKARVEESKILALVAGDPELARRLSYALERIDLSQDRLNRALPVIEQIQRPVDRAALAALRELFQERVRAEWRTARLRERLVQMESDFQLGLGQSVAQIEAAREALREAEAAEREVAARVREQLDPIQARIADGLTDEQAEAVVQHEQAEAALAFWREQLRAHLERLEGEAARVLASAQARRWEREMRTHAQVTRFEMEQSAYRAAPEVYKMRSYLQALTAGLAEARKFFLALDPKGLHLRIEAQDSLDAGTAARLRSMED